MKKKFLLPTSASGQSLVELAISLVVLLYLLSGAVEFGIVFFQFVQLRDAAQEGALYGSTKPDDVTGILARIEGSSNKPIDLPAKITDGTVTVQISINTHVSGNSAYTDRACEGNGLKVEVSYTHQVFMPFMCPTFGICSIPLKASVTDTILSPYKPASASTCLAP